MRGVYDANIKISGNTSAHTMLYITGPSNKAVEVISAKITSSGSNNTNQQLEACWQKVGTLGSPTGTSITPTPTEQGDQAAGSTVVGNITASEPTYTTGVTQDQQGFPSLTGYKHDPLPEERFIIAGGQTWALRLLDAPISLDLDVTVKFREIG